MSSSSSRINSGPSSLERGLAILRLFNRSRPVIGPGEICNLLKIPRATLYRLLQSLETNGFVVRVDTGYTLDTAVLSIGFEYLASLDLVQLANPVLQRLKDKTECSAHLSILDGTEILYLIRIASRSAISANLGVGTRLPAHGTIVGRLLLADKSPDELRVLYKGRRLPAFTRQTPTSLSELESMLDADRKRGYAISYGFYETGVLGIAAPVRNSTGRTVAVVNIAAINAAFDKKLVETEMKNHVLKAADEISALLGNRNVPTNRPREMEHNLNQSHGTVDRRPPAYADGQSTARGKAIVSSAR